MESIKERYVDNLNKEVLILRDENHMLRKKLEESERRINVDRCLERSLDHENHLLKHDLSKVEMLSRSMKIEKDHAIMDTELELIRLQKKLKQLEIDNENVEKDKYYLSDKLTEFQQSSAILDTDLQDSKEIIARMQDDKLRLSQRIEKVTANERALVIECERLKRREKGTKPRESIQQVEQYMRGIEGDRDYWKNEWELLRELQKNPAKSSQSKPVLTNKSPKKVHSKDKQRIKELEQEKEELKMQVNSLRPEKSKSPQRNRSPSPNVRARSPTKDQHTGSEDIVQLKRERDDLRNMLNKLEKRVCEIQGTVKVLTHEKDQTSQLYEQSQKEIRNMRQDMLATQEDGGRATLQIKKLLNRVEMEKDCLQTELSRVQIERDSLQERYKNEKDGSSQLKEHIEKMEMHLDSAERQVANLSSQLAKSEERASMNQQKIATVNDELRLQRDDFVHLRCNAKRLEEDKNQLKSTLSEASQRLREQEKDLVATENELQETRANLSMAEQQLGKAAEALADRENENRQIRKKTDQAVGQVDEFQRKMSILSRDNEKLLENVSELQRSNKKLKNDLSATIDEREDLRVQVQNYIAEVKGAEDLLADRERDQNDLSKQYQILSEESQSFRQRFELCHRDLMMSKQDVLEREHNLERLQDRVDQLEKENIDCKLHNRELESRVNHLGMLASQNRDQSNIIQHERDNLMSDLSALRDLCGRLEKSKEELETELDSRNLDLEQLQANMDDIDHENESLKEDIRSEKEKIRNAEALLNASRSQEQNCISEIQDKLSELNVAHSNLQMAEDKIDQLEREMQRHKTRNNDLERESERLQRSLTNEKFEKDRALSELRIHSLSPVYKPSCYLASGSHRSCSPCRACSPIYN